MKKIIFALILLSIALIGISCVSASQDTNISEVEGNVGSNFVVNQNISTGNFEEFSSVNYVIGQNNLLKSDSGNGAGTFDDLQKEIDNAPVGSVLNLTRDYNGAHGSRI